MWDECGTNEREMKHVMYRRNQKRFGKKERIWMSRIHENPQWVTHIWAPLRTVHVE